MNSTEIIIVARLQPGPLDGSSGCVATSGGVRPLTARRQHLAFIRGLHSSGNLADIHPHLAYFLGGAKGANTTIQKHDLFVACGEQVDLVGHKHDCLALQRATNTLGEQVLAHMCVHCTQWVIQKVDVGVAVNSASK